jgi:hypothetical protein
MRSTNVSAKTANRLRDEIYRQMLRLEAGYPAALPLALALLNACMACDELPRRCPFRQWLRTACPVCLRMIADACHSEPGCPGSH